MLVSYAARRRLEERGCFENIDRDGNRRLNKCLLTFLDLAGGIYGLHAGSFFIAGIALLYQSCRLLDSVVSNICAGSTCGNQIFGPHVGARETNYFMDPVAHSLPVRQGPAAGRVFQHA